jgi:hypothetical protein
MPQLTIVMEETVATPMGIGLIGLAPWNAVCWHLLEPVPGAQMVAVCRRDVA